MVENLSAGAGKEEICNRLRRRRETKNLSIHDVAAKLRIRPEMVEAIEQCNMLAAASRVYFLGYFKSYASLLGMNADEMLESLRAAEGTEKLQAEVNYDQIKREFGDKSDFSKIFAFVFQTQNLIITVAAIVISIMAIIFWTGRDGPYDQQPPYETAYGATIIEGPTPTSARQPPSPPEYINVGVGNHAKHTDLPQKLILNAPSKLDTSLYSSAKTTARPSKNRLSFLALADVSFTIETRSSTRNFTLPSGQYIDFRLEDNRCFRTEEAGKVAVYLDDQIYEPGLNALPCIL